MAPFSSQLPLEVFFLRLVAEKSRIVLKKKEKKLRGVGLILGMSALPCSPDLERVPSRAGQCINI